MAGWYIGLIVHGGKLLEGLISRVICFDLNYDMITLTGMLKVGCVRRLLQRCVSVSWTRVMRSDCILVTF